MAFDKIIGQKRAVDSIKNMIGMGRFKGAYLFLGPDGVGKRTTAIEAARALNCDKQRGYACETCVSCGKISSFNHPDVFIVGQEGASRSIKIEAIRKIIYEASLKPYEGAKRIFIINDAEAMTESAQNCFLKLLEEPPQNNIFILTASNAAGILQTVLSRCKVLKFTMLRQEDIGAMLRAKGIEEEKALLFSHMAMGSLGRAAAFNEKDIIGRRDSMVRDFFFRKTALLREDALAGGMLDDADESLFTLLCWYRDLLVSKFVSEPGQILNIDRYKEITSYAGRFSIEKLEKDIMAIIRTISYTRENINPKAAFFNMAVELAEVVR